MNSYYSNIYWHFTGSPKNLDWSEIYCPKDILKKGVPKSDSECLEILSKILETKCLLAKSKEKIDEHIYTEPFCCVTDIPIQNLDSHKKYYGNVAIGFKHTKIHKEFNPVLYIPKNSLKKRRKKPEEIPENIYAWSNPKNIKKNSPGHIWWVLAPRVDENKLGSYIHNHFKITVFSHDPSDTFYGEREWRKISDFNFEYEAIASVIVPHKNLGETKSILDNYRITDIPILSWELLKNM